VPGLLQHDADALAQLAPAGGRVHAEHAHLPGRVGAEGAQRPETLAWPTS